MRIPIKIKQGSGNNQADIKKALNLNQILSSATAPTKKKWFWPALSLILFLISLVLAGQLFWLKNKNISPYQNFVPQQTKAIVFLKISQLKDLAPPLLPQLELNYSFYRWLKDRVIQFLSETDLSAQKDLAPLFKEDVAFFVFNSSDQRLNWVILAETKTNQEQQKQLVFDKIEQGLREDFGLNQLYYRQIKITSVHSFNQLERSYFYTQINGFVVLSNNLDSLQNLIDRIIDR